MIPIWLYIPTILHELEPADITLTCAMSEANQ